MEPTKFDELTKTLASATSRRQVLKTIATASIGGLFGLAGIRSVFGGGGNSNCSKWCAQVFGPNTSAAGKCTSDAAKGKGICKQCGSKPPSSICCVRNNSGYCTGNVVVGCSCDSTQCQTCNSITGTCVGCPSGQHCDSGTCVANCPTAGQPCFDSEAGQCCPGLVCCCRLCCDFGQVCEQDANGCTCV